jgi:hypothetical protein
MKNDLTLTTQHNVNKETKVPEREITTSVPKVLQCETLSELSAIIGEENIFAAAYEQYKIKFRAAVRTLLASTDDGGQYTNSDESILSMDFSDWLPEVRQKVSQEEKAMKLLGGMDPAIVAKILKQIKAAQK